jgi:Winged helix DNA-binding domain
MIRVDVAERRRRIAARHGLQQHGRPQDPLAAIEDSMYERRELVRMLAMRRTVFVVPAESVPVVQSSTTDRVASRQRVLLLRLLGAAGLAAEPVSWLADLEESVLRVLADRGGTATAAELCADEPRLRTAVVLSEGKPYEAR